MKHNDGGGEILPLINMISFEGLLIAELLTFFLRFVCRDLCWNYWADKIGIL